jgi:hypothetical protein
MKRQADDKKTDRQKRNMQFLDERLELLDTIHKMIDTDQEQRGREAAEEQTASSHLPSSFCQCLSACLSRWLRRFKKDDNV